MHDSARLTPRPEPARRPTARTAAVIATAGLVMLAAACGGSPGSHVADSGATATPSSTSSHPPASSQERGALAFARCVRAHGVTDFPDPNSHGVFPKSRLAGVSVSRVRAAEQPCLHLLPAGRHAETITAQERQDYLKAAACMRSHGIADFPDPTFSGGNVSLHIPSTIDSGSTRFTRAKVTCQKITPPGLPYSGSGG